MENGNCLEQTPTHSVPSTEEAGWVCGYLGEVVLHQGVMAESTVPLDHGAPPLRPDPLIQQVLAVLELLHGQDHHHHLGVVVLEQLVDVRIRGRPIGRQRIDRVIVFDFRAHLRTQNHQIGRAHV